MAKTGFNPIAVEYGETIIQSYRININTLWELVTKELKIARKAISDIVSNSIRSPNQVESAAKYMTYGTFEHADKAAEKKAIRRTFSLANANLVFIAFLLCTRFAFGTEFIGNDACAECHQKAVADWTLSHHDLSMQEANAETILGDFDNAEFQYHGVVSTFSQSNDRYWVTTDNANGELETFPVQYVFGVYPLQQYLLPLPGGRLQALGIAWDARPENEGGQRWYHLYEDEAVESGDPLHWTGIYHNWNSRCAECHSTAVVKGYDSANSLYKTHYKQIDVGCEACHGPGATHRQQAIDGTLTSEQSGLEVGIAERGNWIWPEDSPIAERLTPLTNQHQIDACGRCHSRRSTLGTYHSGRPLLDTHRLALIKEPLYWPDGQIRDEVYVYGSFVQSKMHQAGVVCSDCHNPHSNQLVSEGNSLCSQCHLETVYDRTSHHRHAPDGSGSACVGCHMPSKVYMGVDYRHDHSMRVPRPDISIKTGSPNACTDCHTDRSADWANTRLAEWGVRFKNLRHHPALSFSEATRGDVRAAPSLLRTALDTRNTGILKASAIIHLGNLFPESTFDSLPFWLGSQDPAIRMVAAEVAGQLPQQRRYALLEPLIKDPVLSVRMVVAEQLASHSATAKDKSELEQLFEEYLNIQSLHLDMPSVLTQLGNFWWKRKNFPNAKKAFLKAIELNPMASAPRVNLADLYREIGDDLEARKILELGIIKNPVDSALWFSLGLLEIRERNSTKGLEALRKAANHEKPAGYFQYVYAIALQDQGHTEEAIALLQAANRSEPGQPRVLSALIQYSAAAGNTEDTERYQAQLKMTLQAAGVK